MLIKHGVKPKEFKEYVPRLSKLLKLIDWLSIYNCLHVLYQNESVFLKTSNQYAFFEMMLMQLCTICSSNNNDFGPDFSSMKVVSAAPTQVDGVQDGDDNEEGQEEELDPETSFAKTWSLCVNELALLDDLIC